MSGLRRDAAAKLASEGTGRGLHLVLVYAAQRVLGPASYGHLAFAFAAGAVCAPFTDLGLQLLVAREIARHPDRAPSLAAAGLVVRCGLAVVAVAALAGLALGRPPGLRAATLVASAAIVLQSLVEYIGYVFRGLGRVMSDAALMLALRLVLVILGGLALWRGAGLDGLAAAYLAGGAAMTAAGVLSLRWAGALGPLRQSVDVPRTLLGESWRLGVATVFSLAYVRTPFFVLDSTSGAAAVGVYGVAQKLTEPLALLPAAIMAAVFPAASRAFAVNPAESWALCRRTLVLLGGLGTVVGLAGVTLSPLLVRILYGDQYAGAGRPLQVLSAALLFVFVNYGLTHVLTIIGRQRVLLPIHLVVFAFNVAACVRLSDDYGPTGAAAAILVSEAVLLVLCASAVRRGVHPAGPRPRRPQ